MALKIFWTSEAISSYDMVIDYLAENWSEKEINNFAENVSRILDLLAKGNVKFKSSVKKNYHEVLIDKRNQLIYRINNNHIELITFWGTRSNPRKKTKRIK